MDYKDIRSKRKFAEFLGITEQTLGKWYSRNTLNLDLLVSKFPDVDANWLLTGEGNMLKQSANIGGNAQGDGAMNHSNSNSIIEKFIEEISAQRKMTEIALEQNSILLQMVAGVK